MISKMVISVSNWVKCEKEDIRVYNKNYLIVLEI